MNTFPPPSPAPLSKERTAEEDAWNVNRVSLFEANTNARAGKVDICVHALVVGVLFSTLSPPSKEEEGDDDDELVHGQRKRKVAFMPSVGEYFDYQVVQYELFLHVCYEGTTHTIYYRGHWLRVR